MTMVSVPAQGDREEPAPHRFAGLMISAMRESSASTRPRTFDRSPVNSTPRHASFDESNLVWIDMEMSGLNPDSDRVLELAAVVTDAQLSVIAEGPVIVLRQAETVLSGMDTWNTATHGRSGLTDKVRASQVDEAAAQDQMIAFLSAYVPAGKSPMCGNSICQDRRFMARWLPSLEAHFHYRNVDVSTLKELARRWAPEVVRSFEKKSRHEALADIYESIDELKHYRTHLLKV
jgi:oligoribonuclease